MAAMTRGPLPARVYWVRRVAVLGIAFLLVFGIARLLGGGSDASSDEDQAEQVAADLPPGSSATTSPTGSPTGSPSASTGKPGKKKPSQTRTSAAPVLAEPEGTCTGADIAVTPAVASAVAGRDVMIVLQLRTLESEACTWQVSPSSLAVSITSGYDGIWSSRDCPKAIPAREVVVRKAVTTTVGITWNSRRSDETCSLRTEWAMPGWYHVNAASLGGEPSDVQFELNRPSPVTITRTATPTNSPSGGPTGRPVTPSKSPSGSGPH